MRYRVHGSWELRLGVILYPNLDSTVYISDRSANRSDFWLHNSPIGQIPVIRDYKIIGRPGRPDDDDDADDDDDGADRRSIKSCHVACGHVGKEPFGHSNVNTVNL